MVSKNLWYSIPTMSLQGYKNAISSNTTVVPSPANETNPNQIYFLFFMILRIICLALMTIWNVNKRKNYSYDFQDLELF